MDTRPTLSQIKAGPIDRLILKYGVTRTKEFYRDVRALISMCVTLGMGLMAWCFAMFMSVSRPGDMVSVNILAFTALMVAAIQARRIIRLLPLEPNEPLENKDDN